jgi:hypothetical protein
MKKLTNDQVVLDKILADTKHSSGGTFTDAEWFELFSATSILKDQDLTFEEIQAGIVGAGLDAGIDSFYTFLNGELLREDTPFNGGQKHNSIDVIIIQSKGSPKFTEIAVTKLMEASEDLLDISVDLAGKTQVYNEDLIDSASIFRKIYEKTLTTVPNLNIHYYYAAQGIQISAGLKAKAEKLRTKIGKLISGATCSFDFVTATLLLEMFRANPVKNRVLKVVENPLGTDAESYICLATLASYYDFICDNGNLARSLFELNVRDYEGKRKSVNSAIRATLSNAASDDFWYLNNGVTVITPKANVSGKLITIEDPQIVNGLQTSYEIYAHFSGSAANKNDTRNVLVRIIREQDAEARDRIISATNSQTPMPPVSLRSSEQIHRNIEDYLKSNGIYYDRRRNYYRNAGKPQASIVSISALAQAFMAVVLLRADSARARPTTLINSDADYDKIFAESNPLVVYERAIIIVKRVDEFLRDLKGDDKLEGKRITNLRFYVAMAVSVMITKSKSDVMEKLTESKSIVIDDDLLKKAFVHVNMLFALTASDDKVAKGSQFNSDLLNSLSV